MMIKCASRNSNNLSFQNFVVPCLVDKPFFSYLLEITSLIASLIPQKGRQAVSLIQAITHTTMSFTLTGIEYGFKDPTFDSAEVGKLGIEPGAAG